MGWLVAARSASAAPRPTEGGAYAFAAEDTVANWDVPSGAVRIHFSTDGPNRVRPIDDDSDGIPDDVIEAGETLLAALALYDELGFRALPVEETETLGGSTAVDVYLIDFGGSGDGHYGQDDCARAPCSGFLVIENDFLEGSYPTASEGIRTVVSHEAFHGVQSAYADLPVWVAEGTAVWAERIFDPSLGDFANQCDGYLADTGRTLYQPPSGPVAPFAYGTALWWDFLATRHDPSIIERLLIAIEAQGTEPRPELALSPLLEAEGDTLEDAWTTFVRWNLATGPRYGGAETHAFGRALMGIEATAEGPSVELDTRVFPLAASYFRLEHPGGPLWLAANADVVGLQFSLHALAPGATDGVVANPRATWAVTGAGRWPIVEEDAIPAGAYWIAATYPAVAEVAKQVRLCIGSAVVAEQCDVGDDGVELDEGASASDDDDGGCRVHGRSNDRIGLLVGAVVVVTARRRRRRVRVGIPRTSP